MQKTRSILNYCHECYCKSPDMVVITGSGPWEPGFCDRCGEYLELGSVRSRRDHALAQMTEADAEVCRAALAGSK